MPKNRFSQLDLRRVALELDQRLSGYWINNIYDSDASDKVFFFKLTMPGKEKEQLVVESGVRFHTSQFVAEKSGAPSGFAMKLRKHLRSKRLLHIRQLGEDRVVDITFGLFDKPESQFHVMLELYAAGNVVLTDHAYTVLSLLRVFKDEEVRFAVGENYLTSLATFNRGSDGGDATASGERGSSSSAAIPVAAPVASSVSSAQLQAYLSSVLAAHVEAGHRIAAERAALAAEATGKGAGGQQKKAPKHGGAPQIKAALSSRGSPVNSLGPDLIEHCVLLAGFDASTRVDTSGALEAAAMERLARSFADNGTALIARLNDLSEPMGVLILEVPSAVEGTATVAAAAVAAIDSASGAAAALGAAAQAMPSVFYDRFEPMLLAQHGALPEQQLRRYGSLNDAVDEFFSKVDMHRHARAAQAQRRQAEKKVESIKQDQEKRVRELHDEVLHRELCARAITTAVQEVDRAILVVRSAVASGMSWSELDELVAAEKARGNPIAALIEKTKLDSNEVVLRLPNPDLLYATSASDSGGSTDRGSGSDSDSGSESSGSGSSDELMRSTGERRRKGKARPAQPQSVTVSVDINLSAYANVSAHFSTKKSAAVKVERTIEQSNKVLDDAERRFKAEMERHEAANKIKAVRIARRANWFERFRWFITSEGFLVLSGRDAQQNELIVKRFLRKAPHNDVYVHADVHGASSCIVRTPRPGVAVPPESLRQAGIMTVCQSSAWNAKIVTSAWWVSAEQVSKTAPSGEYLTTGSFMIRGKKNFLPPCRLELVFGFIFKLDETQESFEHRRGEWRAVGEVAAGLGEEHGDDGNRGEGNDEDHAEDRAEDQTEGQAEDQGEADAEADAVADAEGQGQGQGQEQGEAEDDGDSEEALAGPVGDSSTAGGPAPRASSPGRPIADASASSDDDLMRPGPRGGAAATTAASDGKKGGYVTAKERRQMKKGKSAGGAPESSLSLSTGKQPVKSAAPPPKPGPGTESNVRGKKGKLKKIKKKYAAQTEEDKRLAMAALGHKLLNESEGESGEGEGEVEQDQASQPRPPGAGGSPGSEQDKRTTTFAAAAAAATGAHGRQVKQQRGQQPPKAAAEEADEEPVDNAELNLRCFTSNPQPDDVILYALPVCAPPPATVNYKFRAKIVPGTVKKGKASHQAVEIFSRMPQATPRERDVLRQVLDHELINTMPSNVKLSLPGVNNIAKTVAKAKSKTPAKLAAL
jgi:predicted ribosome quality control (RQC) complex YloA/Tae2 family protein